MELSVRCNESQSARWARERVSVSGSPGIWTLPWLICQSEAEVPDLHGSTGYFIHIIMRLFWRDVDLTSIDRHIA
jgi:hypothetical protein